jgi:GST-like protein
MIDFYALTSPNVQKIFIALEELELPYNTHVVDVWKGDQFTPEFTKVNPNQKVPAIVDQDGPGGKPYTVIESGAILLYLAEKTKKLLPADPAKRFDAIQWLFLQHAGVGPMSGQLVHFSKFAPKEGNDYANSRYRTEVNRLFDLYDQRLAQHAYVGGDEYTIADNAAFPWLRNVELLAVDLGKRSHVKKWVEKLSERPAVKRAMAKVATITSVRDSASAAAKDRLFGRGQYARA